MQSLRELYKIGRGPSSSHTMGPERAVGIIKNEFSDADLFKVTLFGSLALTGEGHGTDRIIKETFEPVKCEIVFDKKSPCDVHPNTMDIEAYKGGTLLGKKRVYSVGGGSIVFENEDIVKSINEGVYPLNTFTEIADYCAKHNKRIWEYVLECEGEEIFEYLHKVWDVMKASINQGLTTTGILPGGLGTQRRAQVLYNQRHIDESAQTQENRLVCSYAFAVGEQNASGGTIVTAPTCGACGVVPSVLKYYQEKKGFSDDQIVRALATGGVIGNLIKTNASISGAECGCQAEIGSACCMAAGALAELFEMGLGQIEYAAEVAMEHHLGLTCDPIGGLVQIPCIERNAVAAMRAINALSLANFLTDSRKISFDLVIKVMYETGKNLLSDYRESSLGGLAKHYKKLD
ncbi:MAG: L-serine ammonia-lyase [Ruminococcaceae bacterium]|nr:L-serine ammonia-lyase [Oscillospiraceae bacterium]